MNWQRTLMFVGVGLGALILLSLFLYPAKTAQKVIEYEEYVEDKFAGDDDDDQQLLGPGGTRPLLGPGGMQPSNPATQPQGVKQLGVRKGHAKKAKKSKF